MSMGNVSFEVVIVVPMNNIVFWVYDKILSDSMVLYC
jgi:hypothetical protein